MLCKFGRAALEPSERSSRLCKEFAVQILRHRASFGCARVSLIFSVAR